MSQDIKITSSKKHASSKHSNTSASTVSLKDQAHLNESNLHQGRGGKREGSGRPTGTGKYGEPTKAIRVPEGSIVHIKSFLKDEYSKMSAKSPEHINSNETSFSNKSSNVSILKASHDWTNSDPKQSAQIPLYSTKVAAGIPTMADDHLEDSLDLNEYLVERPQSTFMLKVEGESMKDVGILPDDILIVDRSEKAKHNKIIIAALDGELTVKRLYRRAGELKLLPENPDYPEIEIRREADLVIWGVVIGSFRRFQKNSFF